MALRLDKQTIHELGLIMNEERPSECLQHDCFNSRGATTADSLQTITDCRIFRAFVTLHSLRMSTIFMNASTDDEVRAQKYTLHRAKEHFLLNGLKTVQYKTINEQFKMSMLAISEEKKFLAYIDCSEWPSPMTKIRHNLLKSSVLDGDIESNQGNEHTILPTLRQSLISINPNLVEICDKRLKQSVEHIPSDNQNNIDHDNSSTESQQDTQTTPVLPDVEPENETIKLQESLQYLRNNGIECVNKDWRDYVKTEWNTNRRQADFIITEPPSISVVLFWD